MPLRAKILEQLDKDARLTSEEIAVMIGEEAQTVGCEIEQMEKEGVILAYKTIFNPAEMEDKVTCLIEVSVQPERGHGFDKIAERIYRFPEVQTVFLVSGGYDLLVIVEGRTIREIADFIADKLATQPNVRSTASHFMLKKYKELGTILVENQQRERIPITP